MPQTVTGRRRGTAGPILAAVLAGALIVGCGSSSGSGSGAAHSTTTSTQSSLPAPASGPLSVAPHRITPHSTIRFGFTAPTSSGAHGTHEISYSLSATGSPSGGGCTSAREASGPPAHAGRTSTITLRPATGGPPWCPGRWTARVIELQSARCKASAPCPQYIRVVGIIARTTYVVSAR